jgi:hypothetical protein
VTPPSVSSAPSDPPHVTRRWRRREDTGWRLTLNGVVVLASGATEPVTISGSGGAVWTLLDRPRGLEELTALLAQRFSVEPDEIQRDLVGLLAQLVELGAIEDGADPQSVPPPPEGPFG